MIRLFGRSIVEHECIQIRVDMILDTRFSISELRNLSASIENPASSIAVSSFNYPLLRYGVSSGYTRQGKISLRVGIANIPDRFSNQFQIMGQLPFFHLVSEQIAQYSPEIVVSRV